MVFLPVKHPPLVKDISAFRAAHIQFYQPQFCRIFISSESVVLLPIQLCRKIAFDISRTAIVAMNNEMFLPISKDLADSSLAFERPATQRANQGAHLERKVLSTRRRTKPLRGGLGVVELFHRVRALLSYEAFPLAEQLKPF